LRRCNCYTVTVQRNIVKVLFLFYSVSNFCYNNGQTVLRKHIFQFHSYRLSNTSYTNHNNLLLTSTNTNNELILKMAHVTEISSDEFWYLEFEWMKLNCVKVTILIWFLPSAVTVWPFSISFTVLKFSYHLRVPNIAYYIEGPRTWPMLNTGPFQTFYFGTISEFANWKNLNYWISRTLSL